VSVRYVYVDETKRAGYVVAAVTVADPTTTRKALRGLIVPGRRRVHMHNETTRQRRVIVAALTSMNISAIVYDAGRNYRTDGEARAACLATLVQDLAIKDEDIELVIDQDDSLVRSDRHELYRLVRQVGVASRFAYRHQRSYEEHLLALPDVVAWCWARSTEWRRRIMPIVTEVRRVSP
jgi:hypothetical protein